MVRKTHECCGQDLTGPFRWELDSSADRNVESWVWAPEVSERSKESLGNWVRDHLCDTLALLCVLRTQVKMNGMTKD